MKKILATGLFFLLCIIHLSAQDQDQYQFNEKQTASFPKFISYQPFALSLLADGTSLKYKELKEIISIVPENEKLLRRANGWKIAGWVSSAATFGCFGGYVYYYFNEDAPNTNRENMFTLTILSSACGLIFTMLEANNISHAVHNYNLSIMGIPIPVK
jgi:hypothetical protein